MNDHKSYLRRAEHSFAGVLSTLVLLGLSPLAQAQSSTITRVSSFEYNAEGLLVREVIEPERPQDCLSTTYTYDSYGNRATVSAAACAGASGSTLLSASTPRTAITVFAAQTVAIGSVSYSTPDGAFATQSTNALGQSETKEYDPRIGAVTKLVGPNGGTTTWAYDGFGRKTEERRADGTYTLWEYKFCGAAQAGGDAAPCAAGAVLGEHGLIWYSVESSYGGSGVLLAPKKLQIYDTLDRVVRVQTKDYQGNVVVQDTQYNVLGQVAQKSNLYRLSGGTPAWTKFQYDAIGRLTQEDAPDSDAYYTSGRAITTFAYNGLITTVTNVAGQTKATHKNATGQIAKVVDHLGGQVVYGYDALGQLVQTNAAGSITKIGYTQRGQKAWMEDPAMGRWDYAYNAFGELVRQTDSLSQISTMAYDSIGRMRTRTEPDLVSTWHYDKKADSTACGAGIGKLCEAKASNGYQRVHTYDAIGRPTVTGTKLDSSTTLANMSQAFDPATGRVISKTWPTGYRASYTYSSTGYLSKVIGGGVSGHTQTVTFEVLAMNAQGAITQYKQGNNVTTVKNVDEATGRVRSVQATLTGQGTGNVLNHAYGYDQLGNLTGRSDYNTGVNESFSYDALNRMSYYVVLGGSVPYAQYTHTMYSAAGNIIYKSDVGYYNYDAARPNRLTNITLTPGAAWDPGPFGSPANVGTRRLTYAFDDYRPGAKTLSGAPSVPVGNGNLWYTVSQDDVTGRHTVRWETYTSFNMPKEILFGSLTNTADPTSTVADRTLTFVYGPEHQRVRQDVKLSANAPSHMEAGATWYYNGADSQGLSYEKEVKANGTIEHKHYVNAGGITFALYVKREGTLNGKPATSISYFHHDRLGSIAAVSNEAGAIVERMAYDPWGKRRYPSGTNDKLDDIYGVTADRGYTMHEHLDEMGVIHMNGRVFDPLIGRFMSADPFIQSPFSLKSFNRYSYAWNNPSQGTDPTGYFFGSDGSEHAGPSNPNPGAGEHEGYGSVGNPYGGGSFEGTHGGFNRDVPSLPETIVVGTRDPGVNPDRGGSGGFGTRPRPTPAPVAAVVPIALPPLVQLPSLPQWLSSPFTNLLGWLRAAPIGVAIAGATFSRGLNQNEQAELDARNALSVNEDGLGNTKPDDAPPGTIGLDEAKRKYGWDKDEAHEIKDEATGGMSNGRTWVGVAPDGTVGINENGSWSPTTSVNIGPRRGQ